MSQKRTESPLRSYLWRVVLPDLTLGLRVPSASYGDGTDYAFDLFGSNARLNHDLSTRVVNMSIPFSTVEADKGVVGNSFWYYAKTNDIGSINFEMYEYEDGLTLRYLQAWQNLMFNSNGTYNAPNIYKHDIVFHRLSSDKQEIITHTYNSYFITGIADINNDYEGNDIVKYAVNLTGDSVDHEITPSDSAKGIALQKSGLFDLGTILTAGNLLL